jgi:signal transduction histidine kinase
MTSKIGWGVAVGGTSAVLALMVVLLGRSTWQQWMGLIAIAIFLICWFTFGSRLPEHSSASLPFVIVTIAFSGVITLAHPSLALVQCIAFPLIWTRCGRIRDAIIAVIIETLAVGTAMFASTGGTPEGLWEALVIEAITLAFSIAIGLWITQIATQAAVHSRMLAELQDAQSALAALNQAAGVTSERERLAREIHDTIAQDLTGLVLLAQRAARELNAGDTAAASERLALLEEGARTALAETRALVASTAPPSLDEGGIAAALDRLAQRYERETAIAVTVRVDVETALHRDLEVVLLRCAQEGLANVRKHSGASKAAVTLVARTSELSLRVSDNGSGFDPAGQHSGYGLSGMRDRLALVGGTLDLETGEDGTTLLITLPTEERA